MKKYFSDDLPLYIKGYEERPQQIKMAMDVRDALKNSGNLIVEAGTGVGKTLAYLIPLAEYAIKNNKRVFVSTYSKALQQQIYKMDLPIVSEIFPELKYEVVFGSSNYACRRRSEEFKGSSSIFTRLENVGELLDFVKQGKGLRENAPFHIPDEIWSNINRDSELCFEESCPFFVKCHYWKIRHKLRKMHIVVINHHLFLSDILVANKLLPETRVVLFDEAHRLEDITREMFSSRFSTSGYMGFLNELDEFVRNEQKFKKKEIKHLHMKITAAKAAFKEFTRAILSHPKLTIGLKDAALVDFDPEIDFDIEGDLKDVLYEVEMTLHAEEEDKRKKYYIFLLESFAGYKNTMETFINRVSKKHFYWISREGKEGIILYCTPYSIEGMFKKSVFDNYDSVIFTSATLSIGGNFDYVAKRFGFKEPETDLLKSPFNYKDNSILYVEKHMPEPNSPEYRDALTQKIYEIITVTKGATLILFTNTALMKSIHKEISRQVHHLPMLVQGQAAPSELIEKFKEKPSVLFATSTFWQGIDVKGEKLKCVVITRLPFEMPDHPVQKAILTKMELDGENSFGTYSLPRAVLMLKQGFGRLIRSSTDYGAVLILDKRIASRQYGKTFLSSLPETAMTDSMDDVRDFFEKKEAR